MGLTDGESLEQIWSEQNALGNATKTTGPGMCHDILDDHFGFWNWSKYVTTEQSLVKKYWAAVALHNTQHEAHHSFTATVAEDKVQEWEEMCHAWEEVFPKSNAKNPYHVDAQGLSEPQACKELAEAEQAELRAGQVAYHSTSPLTFLISGLELEDEQHQVSKSAKKACSRTSVQQDASLTEQQNQLHKKLRSWEQVCNIYMPGLLQYHQDSPPTLKSNHPEDHPLWLPSSIPSNIWNNVCIPGLAAAEEKLGTAHCYDSLDNVWHILNLKT